MTLLLDIATYHAEAWAAARAAPKQRKPRADTNDAEMVDATRMAFCHLGAEAASALPRLQAMAADPRTAWLFDDREWVFTLARLGQPVESFAKPDNLSGTVEQYHDSLRRRLQKFRPDRDCGSRYT